MNYRAIVGMLERHVAPSTLFKWGFNLSPMFRRSTARVDSVSDDLLDIRVRLPLSWKNRNYVGSIFGGAMFSAVDPFPMVQLMQLLGKDYVVWDKSAEIRFKRPARESLFADFVYTPMELEMIRERVAHEREFDYVKTTQLTNEAGDKVFCEVRKTLYIASKAHYREKQRARSVG